ncbi:Hypothetical_protein [Hexamita inflata]|uniref:Hypothetical_protein n=1 Tax=Hexamita inflata TaxID=28002 RepID=A0AA86P691_9EUKA|nr:Hypothetical protein HINF_LOCUS19925 [Hexamita inflata]
MGYDYFITTIGVMIKVSCGMNLTVIVDPRLKWFLIYLFLLFWLNGELTFGFNNQDWFLCFELTFDHRPRRTRQINNLKSLNIQQNMNSNLITDNISKECVLSFLRHKKKRAESKNLETRIINEQKRIDMKTIRVERLKNCFKGCQVLVCFVRLAEPKEAEPMGEYIFPVRGRNLSCLLLQFIVCKRSIMN